MGDLSLCFQGYACELRDCWKYFKEMLCIMRRKVRYLLPTGKNPRSQENRVTARYRGTRDQRDMDEKSATLQKPNKVSLKLVRKCFTGPGPSRLAADAAGHQTSRGIRD